MRYIWIILLIPSLISAQEFEFQQEYDTIPVEINGWQPFTPWIGGLMQSNPDLADLDNDGDIDFLVGSNHPFEYFENIGNSSTPIFTYAPEVIGELSTDGWSAPALVDIDNDQDFDLFATSDERVWYWENIGTPESPQFELITDSLEQIVWWATNLDFIDIDADDDYDLFVGNGGAISFYRNQGSSGSFYFVLEEMTFENIDVGSRADPCFVDIDYDDDFDFLIGNDDGVIWYYRNDGDSVNHNFTYITNMYINIDVGNVASPEFSDIDGDGDYDLFVGRDEDPNEYNPGDIYFYENTGTPDSARWRLITKNYFSLDEGDRAKNTSIDIDADGDMDLFLGNQADMISYYENIGTTSDPSFVWITGAYQNVSVNGCDPFFSDIDNDQDPDLFVGEGRVPFPPYPGLYFYQNEGTPQNASFTLISSNLVPGSYNAYIKPALADIDDDGDNDLFMSDGYDHFYFSENIGSSTSPVYSTPIVDWQGIAARNFCFYDCDDDGDLDLYYVFGPAYFDFYVGIYRNIGTPETPLFSLQTDTILGSLHYEVGFRDIDIVDIDDDGDGDIFLGVNATGGVIFFRNITDTSSAPPYQKWPYPCIKINFGPNPANPITWVTFNLPYPQKATLAVYNLLGQKVATLAQGLQPPGSQTYFWNASNFSSGVYLIQLETDIKTEAGKVVVIR